MQFSDIMQELDSMAFQYKIGSVSFGYVKALNQLKK
jgi:hypothetical protein